ncbi:MAG: hypothetical protein R3C11_28410 [Planctomycetaceae bacterium]
MEAFGSPEAYNNWISRPACRKMSTFNSRMLAREHWTDMKDVGIRGTFPLQKPEKENKPANK